jgi:hypothetical protein
MLDFRVDIAKFPSTLRCLTFSFLPWSWDGRLPHLSSTMMLPKGGSTNQKRRINQPPRSRVCQCTSSLRRISQHGIMHAMTISFFRVPWSARRPFHTSTTFSPKEVTLQCQKLIVRTIRSQEMDEFPNPVSSHVLIATNNSVLTSLSSIYSVPT